jgi:hypothetical protein
MDVWNRTCRPFSHSQPSLSFTPEWREVTTHWLHIKIKRGMVAPNSLKQQPALGTVAKERTNQSHPAPWVIKNERTTSREQYIKRLMCTNRWKLLYWICVAFWPSQLPLVCALSKSFWSSIHLIVTPGRPPERASNLTFLFVSVWITSRRSQSAPWNGWNFSKFNGLFQLDLNCKIIDKIWENTSWISRSIHWPTAQTQSPTFARSPQHQN